MFNFRKHKSTTNAATTFNDFEKELFEMGVDDEKKLKRLFKHYGVLEYMVNVFGPNDAMKKSIKNYLRAMLFQLVGSQSWRVVIPIMAKNSDAMSTIHWIMQDDHYSTSELANLFSDKGCRHYWVQEEMNEITSKSMGEKESIIKMLTPKITPKRGRRSIYVASRWKNPHYHSTSVSIVIADAAKQAESLVENSKATLIDVKEMAEHMDEIISIDDQCELLLATLGNNGCAFHMVVVDTGQQIFSDFCRWEYESDAKKRMFVFRIDF